MNRPVGFNTYIRSLSIILISDSTSELTFKKLPNFSNYGNYVLAENQRRKQNPQFYFFFLFSFSFLPL